MKNPELYNRTVDILVDAYFNDTLEYTESCACAVGNLIAGNRGYKIIHSDYGLSWETKNKKIINCPNWTSLFLAGSWHNKENRLGLNEIKCTGYTVEELFLLEKSFAEGVGKYGELDNFSGLMSIVNCLDEIHENYDTSFTAETKKRFNKQLVL